MALYIVARVNNMGQTGYRLLDFESDKTKDVTVESLFNFISKGGYVQNLDVISRDDKKLPEIRNGKYEGCRGNTAVLLKRSDRDLLSFWIYDNGEKKIASSRYISNFYDNVVGAERIDLIANTFQNNLDSRLKDREYCITYMFSDETYDGLVRDLFQMYGSGEKRLVGVDKEKAINAKNKKRAIVDTRYSISDNGVYSIDEEDELKMLVIPEGVVSIKEFLSSKVHKVKFPKSLKTIEGKAFNLCINLDNVDLSETGIETIDWYAFYDCRGLTNIRFNDKLSYLGYSAFNGSGLLEVEIPKGVANIHDGCFCRCSKLSRLKLNEGLKVISENAFTGSNLDKVYIPNSVEYIHRSAFDYNTTLYVPSMSTIVGIEYVRAQVVELNN